MSSGRHTAGGGPFRGPAGFQILRGALLLVAAVVVGALLLAHAPSEQAPVPAGAVHHATTTLPASASGTPVTGATTATTGLARPPTQVTVLVANGTNVSGVASRIKAQLLAAGYNTLAPTNATTSNYTTTTIEYALGFADEAVALAAVLSLPASAAEPLADPAPVKATKGADIIVVVGTDLASAKHG